MNGTVWYTGRKQRMEIIYQDRRIIVAIKPAGVLSTNEPGGRPQLLREYL